MATWIVGDIHGCAQELAALIDKLALSSEDRLISVGDLFHRGPDPLGVVTLLRTAGARFVLGNHELAVLRRAGLAPRDADARERPARREVFPALDDDDLAGDGRQPCLVDAHARPEILRFLQEHSGFWLSSRELGTQTRDGREFVVVHAGIEPGASARHSSISALTSLRRLNSSGHPWWYERYEGQELVLFGHTPSPLPRAWRQRGKLVALGLDTGCVYGGKLCAYSPELDEFVSVPARGAYAHAS